MNSPHFGNRVKARRLLLGLTQEDLGKAVGLSQVSIKKIESGGQTRHGRKIALALRTTLEWLATGQCSTTDADGEIRAGMSTAEPVAAYGAETPAEAWPLKLSPPERFFALSKEERKAADTAIDILLKGIESARKK